METKNLFREIALTLLAACAITAIFPPIAVMVAITAIVFFLLRNF